MPVKSQEQTELNEVLGVENPTQPKRRVIPVDVPWVAWRRYFMMLVYLVLNMLGFILPSPLMIFAQTKFFNNNKDCKTDIETDSEACKTAMAYVLKVGAITNFIGSLLSLWASPVVGRLSDSIGRRPVMIISILPNFFQNLGLLAWAASDGLIPLWGFYILQCVPAFGFTMSSAFVADIMPPHHRATFFSLMSATFSLTSIWANAIAGMFESISWTSFLAFLCQLSALAWAIFVLPETLPVSQRKSFDYKDRRQLAAVMNFFTQMKIVNRNSIFRRLACALLFSSACGAGLGNITGMYLRQELHFSKDNFVRYNEIAGAGGLVVQAGLTPWLIGRLGEKYAIIIGLSVYIVYMTMYGSQAIQTPNAAYLNSLVQDVSRVSYPAISSIKSTLSAGNEQGQILGAISAIQSMASGIGPFVFAGLFEISLEDDAPWKPSDVWFVGVAIMACAVLVTFTVPDPRAARVRQERDKQQGHNPLQVQIVEDERGAERARFDELKRMNHFARFNFGANDPRYVEIHRRLVDHVAAMQRQLQLDAGAAGVRLNGELGSDVATKELCMAKVSRSAYCS
jgi:DHA1 family tetracycline resistance protein-like MFS transporter